MADKKPLVFDSNKELQQLQSGDKLPASCILRRNTGLEVFGAVTINDAEVCVITTSSLSVKQGATYDITLNSNIITATSAFPNPTVRNGTNTQGLPVVVSVTPASGTAVIKLLNLNLQEDSAVLNGTVVITLTILNL